MTLATLSLAAVLATWMGCSAGTSTNPTGTGTPGGTGGSTATSTMSTGGHGGSGTGGSNTGGTGGAVTCSPTEKMCNGACVKVDDPAYGCDGTSCTPCGGYAHGQAACVNNACALGGCDDGFKNCDGNESNGCEADVTSDPMQCGACGSPCNVPHATANCVNGICGVATCAAGYQDCDGDAKNGCEAKPDVDPKNCGMCGKACPTAESCEMGVCGLYCPKGKANCNNDESDGCETPLGTTSDCAFCGDVCAPANAQASCDMNGVCTLVQCNMGWANCDQTAANGCETNTQTDANNCNSCGNVCPSGPHSTAVCNSGGCAINCDPGWADCDNNPNNGCEVHVDVDTGNCGSCNHACNEPNASPTCAGGMCMVAQCNRGFSDCAHLPANGCEINTHTDPNNCGTCGSTCMIANGTPGCANGQCTVGTCAPGWADCDGVVSNGCETHVGVDPKNCGTCGNQCNLANATSTCTGGTCTIGACAPGFADCNNQANDGCEINTTNNPLNCAACNHQCFVANGTAGCSASQCTVAACNPNWGDCNGLAGDGCEIDLTSNLANCGTCGNNCTTACTGNVVATTCGGGTCQIAACTPNHYNVDGTCSDGCECTSTGTSAVCAAPSSLGALQVGQTITSSGNLVPAGQEAYLAVTFNGNTNTGYHPHVTLSAGAAEFAFDILANCGGTAISCGIEGGNSINRTDWEVLYTGGDPNNPPNFNPVPPVGTNGTVIIHVYRRPGKPLTCNNYTLTISN